LKACGGHANKEQLKQVFCLLSRGYPGPFQWPPYTPNPSSASSFFPYGNLPFDFGKTHCPSSLLASSPKLLSDIARALQRQPAASQTDGQTDPCRIKSTSTSHLPKRNGQGEGVCGITDARTGTPQTRRWTVSNSSGSGLQTWPAAQLAEASVYRPLLNCILGLAGRLLGEPTEPPPLQRPHTRPTDNNSQRNKDAQRESYSQEETGKLLPPWPYDTLTLLPSARTPTPPHATRYIRPPLP